MNAEAGKFFKTNCTYCGQSIEVPNDYFDDLVECPTCQKKTLARPTEDKSSKIQIAVLHREKSPIGSFLRFMAVITSWPLLYIGFARLYVAFSVAPEMRTTDAGRALVGEIAGKGIGFLILAGGFAYLWKVAKNIESKWICSKCGNKIDGKQVRVCPTCKSDLITA